VELASQRHRVAALLNDPLWYRIEDCLPAEETAMAENAKLLPEQIQIVEASLAHNHLTRADVTPQAFACLLEQARRFALEIIADSQDYAFVANRQEIAKADLQLASEMRPDHPISLTTQLPKLNLMAQQINRVPLPPIPTQCYSGVLLPPKHHQLTARTFDVVSGAQVAQKMVQSTPSLPDKMISKPKPSYGAARGRQISISLKEKEDAGGPAPMDTTGIAPGTSASTPTTPAVASPTGAAVSAAASPIAPNALTAPPPS
jgi:histone H3/H4